MSMRNDALFETPLPHSASRNGSAYAEPEFEFEDEWESANDEFGDPELENEWEMEDISAYSDPEFENEWEMEDISAYSDPEFEDEWEADEESDYDDFEYAYEGEPESKRAARRRRRKARRRRIARRVWEKVKKVGKRLAKIALPIAGSFAGGPIGGMIGSGVAQALGEAEMEVAQMEIEFFGMNEADAEVAPTAAAKDAALAEVLAAQAAEAATDAEAEAFAAAALHPTIDSMDAQQLRPFIPMLVKFYALLTKVLLQQGVEGQQLLRLLPSQQRVTVATVKNAVRRGERMDGKKAVGIAALAAQKTMGSSKATQKALMRNAAVQSRTARPTRPPRRRQAGNRESGSYCPTCGGH